MNEILSLRIPDQFRFASLSLDGARDVFLFFVKAASGLVGRDFFRKKAKIQPRAFCHDDEVGTFQRGGGSKEEILAWIVWAQRRASVV